MTRQESWAYAYRNHRYLEHATKDELSQRVQDLMHNVAHYTAKGQFAMKNPLTEGPWIEFFTHFLEELKLRGEALDPAMISGGHFDPHRYVSCEKAADAWQRSDRKPEVYLAKFGKLKHLRPLLNVGNIRIAPASYYRDPSLNFSIRDSELEFNEEWHGARVHCPPNGNPGAPRDQWTEIPIIGNIRMTLRAHSDYYITCFSSSYEYRLYDDFEADGCLLIADVVRFSRSLQSRMQEVLPGWKCMAAPVDYRDPYHPKPEINIFFCKHFRYAYQSEVRFVWEPPTKMEALKAINLELGPLTDYCELLLL